MPPLRVATWNVFHGNLGVQTAAQRIAAFAQRAWGLGTHIVAYQEVPQALLGNAGFLNGIQANTGYQWLTVGSEYPPRPPAPPPANQSADGYLILYAGGAVAPNGLPVFFQPQHFIQGIAQARPPVYVDFTSQATGAHMNFLTWHNEAAPMAQAQVDTLSALVGRAAGYWTVAGDLNVLAAGVANPRFPGWSGIDHFLDFILANVQVAGVEYGPPWFVSDANHTAIVGDVNFQV